MIVNVLTDDKTTVQVLQSSLPNVIEVVTTGPQGPTGPGVDINTGSFATTSSLQELIDVTGSFIVIDQTGSFATTSSLQTLIDTTGSFATTGSNSFRGNQSITGSLSVAGPLTVSISNGVPSGVSNWEGGGGWNQGFYSNITASGGTGTGLTVDVAAGGSGYIDINAISINTPGSGYTSGDIVTIDNENNIPGQFTIEVEASTLQFNTSGSLVFPDATAQTTAFIPTTYATTGSNTFIGNQIISGSLTVSGSTVTGDIIPSVSKSFSLGSSEFPFKDIYISSGSLNIASDVPGAPSTVISNVDGNILISAGGMQLLGSASFNATTASFGYISGSMTQVGDYTQTGNYTVIGDKTITGSLGVTGTITTPSEVQANKFTFEDGAVQVNSLGQKVFATDTGTLYQYSGENGLMIMNQEVTQTLVTLSNSGDLVVSGSITSSGVPVVTSTNVGSIQTITSASYAALTPVSGTLYIIIG